MSANVQNGVQLPKGWALLKDERGVRTGEVKLSFPKLFELDPTAEFNKDKYNTSIVLTEEQRQYLLNVVVTNTYNYGIASYQKWGGKQPNNFQLPEFKEMTPEEAKLYYPNYQGKLYRIMAKTSVKPKIIDLHKNEIADKNALYSGVVVRLTLTAFPWYYAGKTGVSFSVGIVQKIADAPRIGGSQASDITVFDDTSDIDFDAIGGGDPFNIAQAPQMPMPQQVITGNSNDRDLMMPMPQQAPMQGMQPMQGMPQQAPKQYPFADPNQALPF